MEYKIEKNVPLQDHNRGSPKKYPFSEMEVGDSFLANEDWKTVAVAAQCWQRKHGFKFTMRKQPDGTVRCWRVA